MRAGGRVKAVVILLVVALVLQYTKEEDRTRSCETFIALCLPGEVGEEYQVIRGSTISV